jgi:DNA-directed RNA polymerase specialized sigma24 family protein
VLRDHDAAEELPRRIAFATWLHRIAMNECRDILRDHRRHVDVADVPEKRLATSFHHAVGRLRTRLSRSPA